MANDTEKCRVMNKGARTFHTSVGALPPQGVLDVPKSEAAILKRYPEIVDVSELAEKKVHAVEPKRHEEVVEPDEKPETKRKVLSKSKGRK